MAVDVKNIKNKIDLTILHNYHYEIGIIKDRYASVPIPKSTKQLAGGLARRIKGKSNEVKVRELFEKGQKRDGILTKPFLKSNLASENRQLSRLFNPTLNLKAAQIKNILTGLVQRPILRGRYGSNSTSTILTKGFDRKYIDTGTMINSIDAIRVSDNVK